MVAVLVAAYWQVALCQYTLQWDMTDQAFVWHRFISECFHSGIIPLWAPYSKLGYPFYADPQSGLFYPIVWLLALASRYSLYSNNIELFIHIVLAALGMRYLLRTLRISEGAAAIFGLVYAMSGPATGHATHSTLIASMCWLPWLMGSYIRVLQRHRMADLLLTVGFVLMQLTGGYAGMTIILLYVMAGLLVYYILVHTSERRGALLRVVQMHLCLGALVLMVSGGYLYAVAQGQPYIDRGEGVTRASVGNVPFSPRCLVTLLYPQLVGAGEVAYDTDITMQSLYMGIIPLVLVLLSLIQARRRSTYIIAISATLMLLAAMGDHTPLRGWLYDYIPLMKFFRHAGIFRLYACIGWIILAARGYDAMEGAQSYHLRSVYRYLIIVLLLLSVSLWISASVIPVVHHLVRALATHSMPIALCALTAVAIILIPGLTAERRRILLGILILSDLGLSVQAVMTRTIISDRQVSVIQKRIDHYPQGFPMPDNVPITSFNQWNDTTIAPPVWQNAGFIRKQLSFEGYNGFKLKSYNLIHDRPDFFDTYRHQNLVSADSGAIIHITSFDPDHIGLDIETDHAQHVVLGQVYFPGWICSVDHAATTAAEESPDHFVSSAIPKGRHTVQLEFVPRGGRLAFWYSIITFTVLISATAVVMRRSSV